MIMGEPSSTTTTITTTLPSYTSLARSQSQSQSYPHPHPHSAPQQPINHHRSPSTRSTITNSYSLNHDMVIARSISPDRVSTTSSNLTSATPQLRKKPNLTSIKLNHQLRGTPTPTEFVSTPTAQSSGLVTINDISSFSPPTNKDLHPLRSQVSRTNSVSSATKKPPASHSSYGVETHIGPPPSYDTQRTLSQERIRTISNSGAHLRMNQGEERGPDPSPSTFLDPGDPKQSDQSALGGSLQFYPSPDTADTQSIPTPTDGEEIVSMEVREEQGLGVNRGEEDGKDSTDSQKSEDLFLNIAKVDATRPPSSRAEKRRTRISLPFLAQQNRPATSHKYSPVRADFDVSNKPPQAEVSQYYSKRSSLGAHVPGAFSRLNTAREKSEQFTHDDVRDPSVRSFSRRGSAVNTDPHRPVLRTNTSLRINKPPPDAVHQDKTKLGEHIATESTMSTTAPSTVWDELDDLKSRIRKLELTGKLPPSSAAAMSSAERPKTATTAPTTLSGSPKHNKAPVTLHSTIEGVASNVHPLLHEALGNAKQVVSNDVYSKLYSTAQDALQLASMMSSEGQISHITAQSAIDRQFRRRTESMCRSLTELAIALASEPKAAPTSYRAGNMDSFVPPNVTLRSRRHSNEPGDRPSASSRVQSRLESRRTSLQYGYTTANQPSPEQTDLESPKALPPFPNSRPSRTSTALRNRRAQGNLDVSYDHEEDPSPSIRPVSRAVTDSGASRRFSRDPMNFSREYTSQHPLPVPTDGNHVPTQTPALPSINTGFMSRRKRNSPATAPVFQDSSPLSLRDQWGRISIVPQDHSGSAMVETMSEAPGSGRSVSTRRSFGFASRIGSSVGSRLRAVKAERSQGREMEDTRSPRERAGFEERNVEQHA